MYQRRGEYRKATKDFQEVVRLKPTDAAYQIAYAWLLVNYGDNSVQSGVAAMQPAKAACELTSWTNWYDIEILASACSKAGEYKNAVDYEKQAMNAEGLKEEERANMLKRLLYYDDRRWRAETTNLPPTQFQSAIDRKAGHSSASSVPGNGKELNEAERADLKTAAESGDSAAQLRLAKCFYEGRQGFITNRVEAYKWATIVAEDGNREGRYLIREIELFMQPEEISQAKSAARAFLERLKKKP
jgi:tetratricopeptide (TPR) repeat protein